MDYVIEISLRKRTAVVVAPFTKLKQTTIVGGRYRLMTLENQSLHGKSTPIWSSGTFFF